LSLFPAAKYVRERLAKEWPGVVANVLSVFAADEPELDKAGVVKCAANASPNASGTFGYFKLDRVTECTGPNGRVCAGVFSDFLSHGTNDCIGDMIAHLLHHRWIWFPCDSNLCHFLFIPQSPWRYLFHQCPAIGIPVSGSMTGFAEILFFFKTSTFRVLSAWHE
jgi:hypothetical protein